MMDIEYLETKAMLERINACAKYGYFLVYSDHTLKTYDLIRVYSDELDEDKDGYETIADYMTWPEVVSAIKAMYCIMQHECLEEEE